MRAGLRALAHITPTNLAFNVFDTDGISVYEVKVASLMLWWATNLESNSKIEDLLCILHKWYLNKYIMLLLK